MITFAILSIINGTAYINDQFVAQPGEVKEVYQECKKHERMLSPCLLMSERNDGKIVFTNIETWQQLVVEK